MKFLSISAVLGVAAVAFLSVTPTEAANALTVGVLGDVRVMEAQVHALKDSFDAYLAGDCAQTPVAYEAMADLIRSIESTKAEIQVSGKILSGSDVDKIGEVLHYTAETIHEIIDDLIENRDRLEASGAVWIVQKGLPIFQKEYEAFKLVLISSTDRKRRDEVEEPITDIVNEITRGVVAFQQSSCSCYNPNGGSQVANYGIGLQLLISVSVSINISRRDLAHNTLASI